MTRAASRTLLVVLASFAFIGAVLLVDGSIPLGAGASGDFARGGPHVAADNPEAAEQAEQVAERQAAYAASLEAGTFGTVEPIAHVPTAGWVGEQVVDPTVDDWEPAIAADPHSGYVYALVTRYGVPKPCQGNCPTPVIELLISANNGATWSAARPLCACKGSGQYDPIIEVVPNTGDVYALFLIGFNVVFTKSVDHGQHWSDPVPTWGNVSWNDKPVIATSNDGQDVYVSFNGPTGGDPWAVQSHDGGVTWSQFKLVDSKRYFFAFDADVAPDGTVYFSEGGLVYTNAGNSSDVVDTIEQVVFISRDHGTTWETHLVATVRPGVDCDAAGCSPDFYVGHSAVTVDAAGGVTLLIDGANDLGGLQTIRSYRSVDRGQTWTGPAIMSVPTENATAPAAEAGAAGDVRAWYYQTSGGGNDDAWNVWYRRSGDGGATWSAPVRISDATSGAPYKTAAGFAEVYGDYGEIAINSAGKTIGIWGEGISWTGPGGVWFNREQ